MIKEINNIELDSFLKSQKYSQFLQSSSWNKFQKSLGQRTWQLGIVEQGAIKAVASVIEKKMALGFSYLYCPRGPIIFDQVENRFDYLKLLLKSIRDLTISTVQKEEVFFRFEPLFLFNLQKIKKVGDIQPSHTLVLDLSKSEQELLANMH